MKHLRFERSGREPYQVVFYAGEYYYPVERELLDSLKGIAPEALEASLMEKLGFTSYLKRLLSEEFSKSEDRRADLSRLAREIKEVAR